MKQPNCPDTKIALLCDNALITEPIKFANITIKPIDNSQTSYLIDWARDFCEKHSLPIHTREIIAHDLTRQANRIRPTFVVFFDGIGISLDDGPRLGEHSRLHVPVVLGAIAYARQAYPRVRFIIAWENRAGSCIIRYSISESYYRGNIIGGRLGGEKPGELGTLYDIALKDSIVRSLLGKYRLALSEVDIDLGYFRFWSLLESMCYLDRRNNSFRSVLGFVRDLVEQQLLRSFEKPNIHGRSVTLTDLVNAWYEGRNLTAHHGGAELAAAKGKKMHGTYKDNREAIIAEHGVHDIGVDTAYFLLKDIVLAALKHVIARRSVVATNATLPVAS